MIDQVYTSNLVSIDLIQKAHDRISEVIVETPLVRNINLSRKYNCQIFLKREDLQSVRSFKIRGAYNKISSLTKEERDKGIICASAGNHAQGVAFACSKLKIKGKIVMPDPTPVQKINRVKHFGGEWIEILLYGDNFDEANAYAIQESESKGISFIHPFNDQLVIAGQATVALEMINQQETPLDFLLVAVGGGGLISGVGSYFKQLSPETKIVAVESEGACALYQSLENGHNVTLDSIDTFADGIAVKKVGDLTFPICQNVVDDCIVVTEGRICSTILQLYNEEAIVAEPAGAISIAALDQLKNRIEGKTVGIILCGGNNDVSRTQEITERALLYEGKKHYFIIRFPQRAGALKEFLSILGPKDDITHFEYTKKTNRVNGPALVGIELEDPEDYSSLVRRMKDRSINFQHINNNPMLFEMLV